MMTLIFIKVQYALLIHNLYQKNQQDSIIFVFFQLNFVNNFKMYNKKKSLNMKQSEGVSTPSTNPITLQSFSQHVQLFKSIKLSQTVKSQGRYERNHFSQNIAQEKSQNKQRKRFIPKQSIQMISNYEKRLKEIPERECRLLTRSLVNSGKNFYINLLGEDGQEILKRVDSSTKFSKSKQFRQFQNTLELTENQRIQQEYIKNQQQSKEILQKRLDMLKLIFKTDKSKFLEQEIQGTIQAFQNQSRLPYLIERRHYKDKDQNTKNIKIKRGNGLVSKEKVLVAQNFLEMKKYLDNSLDFCDKIYNVDKYDLNFTQYSKKKTNKRISNDYQNQQKNKKNNIIYQFQNYLIHHINLSQKNKDNVIKGFTAINKEIQKTKQKA